MFLSDVRLKCVLQIIPSLGIKTGPGQFVNVLSGDTAFRTLNLNPKPNPNPSPNCPIAELSHRRIVPPRNWDLRRNWDQFDLPSLSC